MTTTTEPTRTWHALAHPDGSTYHVRTQPPAGMTSTDMDTFHEALGMTTEQGDRAHAIHEAAHAVAALAGRGYVLEAQVNIPWRAGKLGSGHAIFGYMPGVAQTAAALAAGERAETRWLHETGLWTPRRGIAIEIDAATDRKAFTTRHPEYGFGDTDLDYLDAHDIADTVIDRYWAEIQTVANALLEHHTLSGDAIADIAGLPNGTHFNV